jgi:hypothetical protein
MLARIAASVRACSSWRAVTWAREVVYPAADLVDPVSELVEEDSTANRGGRKAGQDQPDQHPEADVAVPSRPAGWGRGTRRLEHAGGRGSRIRGDGSVVVDGVVDERISAGRRRGDVRP